MDKSLMTPFCCGIQANWIDNGPRLQYFMCGECRQEVLAPLSPLEEPPTAATPVNLNLEPLIAPNEDPWVAFKAAYAAGTHMQYLGFKWKYPLAECAAAPRQLEEDEKEDDAWYAMVSRVSALIRDGEDEEDSVYSEMNEPQGD